jgi:catechol 2,3-dioxygenase-like lactoylglutathione lyase family enzyme
MIDHLTWTVRDIGRTKAFYTAALAPLGYAVVMEFEGMLGMGTPEKPFFWLRQGEPPTTPMHLAFRAKDRPSVDAFHAAALAAGARDNGKPGLRPDYHPNYYGAFVFDPDGHPIEAVCHYPPGGKPRAKPARAKRAPARTAPRRAPKGKKKPTRRASRR